MTGTRADHVEHRGSGTWVVYLISLGAHGIGHGHGPVARDYGHSRATVTPVNKG